MSGSTSLAPKAVNTRTGDVVRAQRAMRRAPDTRAIKVELQRGNHYVVAMLRRRGVMYLRGSGLVSIHKGSTT